MAAAHLSSRMAKRLDANNVATVRSALVPGLIPRDLSAASQPSKPSAILRIASRRERIAPVRRLATDRLGGRGVKFSCDVRVGDRREKGQIDGERRPARFALPLAGGLQRRQAERENVVISRDILPRDAVPLRRLRHGLAQGHGGRGVDVMPRRASEAAWIGGGYGGEDVLGVRMVETIEHPGQGRAQSRMSGLRGRRKRRAQEDDAEIGVLTDSREGRLDSGADAGSDPRPP